MAPWGVPLEETTLAERFKAAGYATHMVSFINSTTNPSTLTHYVYIYFPRNFPPNQYKRKMDS